MQPTFQVSPRSDRDPSEYVKPLPPSLREALDGPEAERHSNLAHRYAAKVDELTEAGAKVEAARAQDEAALAKALEQGRKPPARKAESAEHELEERRHEVEILSGLLVDAAGALLAVSIETCPQVSERLRERVADRMSEALTHLRAAGSALDEADRLAAEEQWVGSLAANGTTQPWRGGAVRVVPQAEQLIKQATERLENEPVEREQRAEHHRRQLEEARKLPLPPGAQTWQEPEAVTG